MKLPLFETNKEIDPWKIKRDLDCTHAGLEAVKMLVLEYIIVDLKQIIEEGKAKGQISCLVGKPGTGKTTIIKSIAKSLELDLVKISLNNVCSVFSLVGFESTYVAADSGLIINGIINEAKHTNSVILFDEIDKLSCDTIQGNPASALLNVLDYELNSEFTDVFIGVPYDLSKFLFFCTANYEERIPPELKNRLKIINIPDLSSEDKQKIIKKKMAEINEELRVESHFLPDKKQIAFTDEAVAMIVRKCKEEDKQDEGMRLVVREAEGIIRRFLACKKLSLFTPEELEKIGGVGKSKSKKTQDYYFINEYLIEKYL